jgi:hypothetical protein
VLVGRIRHLAAAPPAAASTATLGRGNIQGVITERAMNLTAEQLASVRAGELLRFTDPVTKEEFIILRADVYDRVKTLLAGEMDPREWYAAVDEAFREDWNAPGMAEYDRYEKHKQ